MPLSKKKPRWWNEPAVVIFLLLLLVCATLAWVTFIETPRRELQAYEQGQQACMQWYGIDPYAEEAEAHGL